MVKVIIDTNLLIEEERTGGGFSMIGPDDEIAVAAISIAELREGLLSSHTEAVANERQEFLNRIGLVCEILPYTELTAVEHAALLRHCRVSGSPRGAHDLIIAAHARETGRTIVTADRKARFTDLPGALVRQPSD